MKSNWLMVEMNHAHNIIFIEDVSNKMGGPSITNDAEAVYGYIDDCYSHAAPTPMRWRIVYKDTNNEWWEMIPNDEAWSGLEIGFERWHGLVWDALKGKTV